MIDRFEKFLIDAKLKHKNFYTYDKASNYKNAKTNITITCPIHGDFEQRPTNHLSGKGCPKCGVKKLSDLFKKDVEKFISDSMLIHNNKYSYDNVDYKDDATKILITCPTHGDFEQSPNKHLRGQGCPLCKSDRTIQTNRDKHSKIFPKISKDIHSNRYDYSKVNYKNSKTNVTITCLKHGDFEQRPGNHLSGKGCPKCNQSRGELVIEKFLIKNNINYTTQKKFDDCVNKSKLSFDFWIEDMNTLIEYDGEQHFKPIGVIGGIKKLEYTQLCDKIKNEYCKNNNIRLIRISYKDFKKIDSILHIALI